MQIPMNPQQPQQPAAGQPPLAPNQSMRGIDPDVIRAMMSGVEAQQHLIGAENQMAQAQALRDTAMPEMVKDQAASPLSFLATLVNRRRGASDLNKAQAQAAALRGEVGLGEQASMLANLQEKGYDDQLTLDSQMRKFAEARAAANAKRKQQLEDARRERGWDVSDSERDRQHHVDDMLLKRGWTVQDIDSGRAYEQEVRNEARTYEEEQKARSADELATDYETWYDAEGKPINAARTVGGYMVDGAGNKLDMTNLTSMQAKKAENEVNKALGAQMGLLPAADKKVAREAYELVDTFNEISTMAGNLKEGDMDKLMNPAVIKLAEVLSPDKFENYIKSNLLGFSSEGLQYLQKLNEVSAKIRHGYYGSALTGQEIKFSEAWLPNETGMKPAQIQARINALKNTSFTKLKSIDDLYGTQLGSKKFGYDDWYTEKMRADRALHNKGGFGLGNRRAAPE